MRDSDLRNGEAEPSNKSQVVAVNVSNAQERLDGAAAQDRIAADEPVDRRFTGKPVQRSRESSCERAADEAMRALRLLGQHYVISLARFRMKLGDEGGIVLQIAVEDDHMCATRVLQSGRDGVVLAEVAAQFDPFHSWIGRAGGGDARPGSVATAVLDEHDLEICRHLLQRLPYLTHEFIHDVLGAIHGADDGDHRHIGPVHRELIEERGPRDRELRTETGQRLDRWDLRRAVEAAEAAQRQPVSDLSNKLSIGGGEPALQRQHLEKGQCLRHLRQLGRDRGPLPGRMHAIEERE
jgi:hypothetical protein